MTRYSSAAVLPRLVVVVIAGLARLFVESTFIEPGLLLASFDALTPLSYSFQHRPTSTC